MCWIKTSIYLINKFNMFNQNIYFWVKKQYFEFNKGHIWFNIYKNNKWFKVDSLSGINEINTIKEDNSLLKADNSLLKEENSLLNLKSVFVFIFPCL